MSYFLCNFAFAIQIRTETQENHEESSKENKAVAAVAVFPHRCHSAAVLHTVLHPVVRPDAAACQRRRERGVMDGALRHGQDLPVRRHHHPRR